MKVRRQPAACTKIAGSIPAAKDYNPAERAFKTGLLLGLAIGLVVAGLVIWLWAVPAVEAANDLALRAVTLP